MRVTGQFPENISHRQIIVRKKCLEEENPFSESYFIFDQIKRLHQKRNFRKIFSFQRYDEEKYQKKMNLQEKKCHFWKVIPV